MGDINFHEAPRGVFRTYGESARVVGVMARPDIVQRFEAEGFEFTEWGFREANLPAVTAAAEAAGHVIELERLPEK